MNEQDIFLQVLKQADSAGRLACLENACQGQPQLRQRVEVLLRAHERAGRFLESPAAGPDVTSAFQPLSEGPGTVIGPYKLLQQIGEGGFGVVYMAEQQQPVRRKVALKIIKPGMDTKEVIARFESERQALALMDHPNIARVFDAGATESGRPYFVMELVKGLPITEFADKNRQTVEQRLELFSSVCQAVQHAHQKGVIHRDLKPSNVMVTLHDGLPVAKVIDFGVAKATSQQLTQKTLFTAYGQMIGTPVYMSPEQAEMSGLDIDTRSDIYSLGVLLYELLTGTTPLELNRLRAAGFVEMQRLIREEEAPRPSTRFSTLGGEATALAGNRGTDAKRLGQSLRGDLDWIVMKSLEKDRNRRYESPSAFAADIQRFLSHDAILARPPSAIYSVRKFIRRNRVACTTGTLVALSLLGGILFSSLAARDALYQRRLAEDSLRVASADRQRAEQAQTNTVVALAAAERERDRAEMAKAEESKQLQIAQQERAAATKAEQSATQAQQSAVQEKNNALATREELRQTLYAAEMNLVQSAVEGKQYGRAAQLLDQQKPPAGQNDLRGFEWHYWQRRLQRGQLRSVEAPSMASNYRWTGTRSFSRHGERLASLVSYPDEVASAAGPRLLAMVDGISGRELLAPFDPFSDRQGKGDRKQRLLSMSDDGTRLAVGLVNHFSTADDRFGSISIRDGETGSETRRLEIPGVAFEIALTPDGSQLAVECGLPADPRATSGQSGITIWDASTGELLQTLPLLPRTTLHSRILWSPDGTRLLRQSVSSEKVNETERYRELFQVVEVASGEKIWEREFSALDYPYYAGPWSPDGKLLVIWEGAESGSVAKHDVQLWDSNTGKTLAILDHTETRANLSNIAFSPDGQMLAIVCGLNEIYVWEVPKLALAARESPLHLTTPLLTLSSVKDLLGLAFSADSRELVSLDGGASIVTWDATAREDTGIGPDLLELNFAAEISSDASKVAFAVGGQNPVGILWDLVRNEKVFPPITLGLALERPAFSHDGRRVAFAQNASTTQPEAQIVIHDAQTGAVVNTIPIDKSESSFLIQILALRPDGGQIAALLISRSQVQNQRPARLVAWDVDTGKRLFSIAIISNGSDAPDYSVDGASVILATNDGAEEAVFFDANTGERRRSIALPGAGRAYTINERIQMFYSWSRSQSDAVFWDLATGQERLRLSGYGGGSAVAISPDGSRLVLGKSSYSPNESELTLWNLKSGRRLLALNRPGRINKIAFSPDGNRLVAAFHQLGSISRKPIKPIQIWDATPLANP